MISQQLTKQILYIDILLKTNIFSEEEIEDYEYHQHYRSISFDQLEQIIYKLQRCSLTDEYAFADAIIPLDVKLNNIVCYFKYVYGTLRKFFVRRLLLLKHFIKARHLCYADIIQKNHEISELSRILFDIYECLYRIDIFSGNKTFSSDHKVHNRASIARVIASCAVIENVVINMEKHSFEHEKQWYDDIVILYINLRNVMRYFEQLYNDVRTVIQRYPLSR